MSRTRRVILLPVLLAACFLFLRSLQQTITSPFTIATESASRKNYERPLISHDQEFPHNFWQISTSTSFEEKWKSNVMTWVDLNPDWEHRLMNTKSMNEYVQTHYAHRSDILGFWNELTVEILRTDLFRYLALMAEGGVYSDMDTTAFKPIDEWIPPHLRSSEINVVAGLEYADTTYHIFPRNISFCQWTLMAKPNHSVYASVVQRVISRIEYIARIQKVPISDIKLGREEILASTGPGAFSDAILEVVRDQTNNPTVSWNDFYGLREPTLFGDVLVLPINGFGSGQKHSNSGKDGYGQILMRHHFGSSWFKKKKKTPPTATMITDTVQKPEVLDVDNKKER